MAASWSLLVILGLITWSLGAGVFPTVAPDTPAAAVWVVAAVTAVGFFACLLAHELAHSLVARAAGMRVDGIVLWMFGGMSRLAARLAGRPHRAAHGARWAADERRARRRVDRGSPCSPARPGRPTWSWPPPVGWAS